MISERTPKDFVKESYIDNNQKAIEIFSSFLIKRGYHVIDKEEDYWIDIEAEKEGQTLLFEVEMKSRVKFSDRGSFPFDTVSFLARKEKWKATPFWYCIICESTGFAVIANSDKIYKQRYRESINVNTKHRKGLDSFYRVPKEECYFVKVRS